MSVEQNKMIAEAEVQCAGPTKLNERLSYYSENPAVWDSVMRVLKYAESNWVVGFEEVKRFFTWLAGLPPIEVRVLSVFGEGDKVAVEWTLVGEQEGRRFEVPCVNLYDFENGKIKSARMHFDSAYFAEVTGTKG